MMMYIQPRGVNMAVEMVTIDGRWTIANIGTLICSSNIQH